MFFSLETPVSSLLILRLFYTNKKQEVKYIHKGWKFKDDCTEPIFYIDDFLKALNLTHFLKNKLHLGTKTRLKIKEFQSLN